MAGHTPSRQKKAVRVLLAVFPFLLFLLFAAGFVYFVLLPQRPLIAQGFYVDENALGPGQARIGVNADDEKYMKKVEQILSSPTPSSPSTDDGDTSSPLSVPEALFHSLGMEVHYFSSPHGSESSRSETDRPSIVYGILRAPKSDGKECIALVSTYSSHQSSPADGNNSGMAISAAVLRSLSRAQWLSKDIVFVAVREDNADMKQESHRLFQSWVAQYFSPSLPQPYTPYNKRFVRAGIIVTAIVVDIPSYSGESIPFDRLTMLYGGPNGKMPNLDIVTTISKVCMKSKVPLSHSEVFPSSHPLSEQYTLPPLMKWAQKHRTFLRVWATSAAVTETRYHGHFLHYNVDAVTLTTPTTSPEEASSIPFHRRLNGLDIAKMLEGTVRSFNNLIEKLHHSTFFYVVSLANKDFITMSKYFPMFLLFAIPLPLLAFKVYFTSRSFSFAQPAFLSFLLYALSFAAFALPNLLHAWQTYPGSSTSSGVRIIPTASTLSSTQESQWIRGVVMCSALVTAVISRTRAVEGIDWSSFHAFFMLSVPVLLLPISLLDFPLALCVVIVVTPLLCLAAAETQSFLRFLIHLFVLATLSPLSLLYSVAMAADDSLFSVWTELKSLLQLEHQSHRIVVPVAVFLVYIPSYLASFLLFTSSIKCSRAPSAAVAPDSTDTTDGHLKQD